MVQVTIIDAVKEDRMVPVFAKQEAKRAEVKVKTLRELSGYY